jgi:hypothetical protein
MSESMCINCEKRKITKSELGLCSKCAKGPAPAFPPQPRHPRLTAKLEQQAARQRCKAKRAARQTMNGVSKVWSPVNQAWLVLWHDTVLRVISDTAEADAYVASLLGGTP